MIFRTVVLCAGLLLLSNASAAGTNVVTEKKPEPAFAAQDAGTSLPAVPLVNWTATGGPVVSI